MKHIKKLHRLLALALCLVLSLPLLGDFRVSAADEIWTEEPLGWRDSSHVIYKRVDGHLCNWGVRGETCLFLSGNALSYYSDNEWGVGLSWGWFMGNEYEGGTGTADATKSPLYTALHNFLAGKQTHQTSYDETKNLFQYTDCMVSNNAHTSSFYSGRKMKGAWDYPNWNREHTWPNSKCTAPMENDIMMLRPTSSQENSSRGNLAYGESEGYYNPNSEAGGRFDLRGDCARICLYCYVRWSENAGNMWGASGVMESLDVLLSWMEQDPVDTWEMGRNDAVEDITGVRNVFVDYPELAWKLFGREAPASYPTPMNGGGEWPPVTAIMAEFTAEPDDPAHGSVQVSGLCATPVPASGYYASGYEVVYAVPWYAEPNDPTAYDGLLRWDRYGRLLCLVNREVEVSVIIHFTPNGQTDPCPTGHALDYDHPEILKEPTCTEQGLQRVVCKRCGKTKELPIDLLWHEYGPGEILQEPTIDQPGIMQYACIRCGEVYTEEILFEFEDVSDVSQYYYHPVYWAVYHDPRITSGSDATHFGPKKTCTREQIVTFLWKAAGAPEPGTTECAFTDVTPGKYYYKAVLWAVEKGITGGVSADKFGVGKSCTREQAVSFLWKACGSQTPETAENPFTDVTPDKYFYKPVLWALENGITGGASADKFGVGKPCTRGQIVTFLYKASFFL